MPVNWLRQALENLDEEAEYLATESPQFAAEFVIHMRNSVTKLEDHPDLGRPGRIAGSLNLHFFSTKAQTVRDQLASEEIKYSRMVSRTYFQFCAN